MVSTDGAVWLTAEEYAGIEQRLRTISDNLTAVMKSEYADGSVAPDDKLSPGVVRFAIEESAGLTLGGLAGHTRQVNGALEMTAEQYADIERRLQVIQGNMFAVMRSEYPEPEYLIKWKHTPDEVRHFIEESCELALGGLSGLR